MAGSVVVRSLSAMKRAVESSVTSSMLRTVAERLVDVYRRSQLAAIQTEIARASTQSAVSRGTRRIAAWTKSSLLFRWLTKEPDPAVIVIDLTETRTVGPIIRLLDAGIGVLDRARSTSAVDGIASTVGMELRRRPVQTVSIAALALVATIAVLELLAGDGGRTIWLLLATITVLSLLGLRVDDSWSELTDRWIVRFAIAVLEPPEPPDDERSEG